MHKESNFEHSIEQSLLEHGGYSKGDPLAYDKKLALFPDEVVAFVQDSQPEFWERFSALNNGNAKAVLIESLVRELRTKGMLSILRSGFKCFGKTVRIAFFQPNTGMEPLALERFSKNRLTVIRQLETESGAIPDMVLAVNGLPVVTIELKNPLNEKIFHSVVVITDRVVLDQQLQDTIFQFEHKQGVVQKIDENTQQLAKALADGVPIIISTIQKFPFITQALATLENKGQGIDISTAGRRFAVIVDEAHSSQSGETAMELKKILNREGIESAIAEQILDMNDEPLSEAAKRSMLRDQIKRTKQPNLSFFAFTATPKFKTLAIFDEPGENGASPFHLYSMRQAIEEGFILDVLEGYTCYKRYYQLIRTVEDDPELPRRKAARALARYVDLHDYNITQKVKLSLSISERTPATR